MVLMAIGSLALIPGVAAPYIGAFVLILLPGFFLNPKNEPFTGYTLAWHVAVVIFLLWTTAHLILSGHMLHITLSYQLSFVILYRMLTPKKPRHYQEIWYWCLSSLILAGFWTTSIVFIGVVILFTLLSVFAFSYATALREEERHSQAKSRETAVTPPPAAARRYAGPMYLGGLALLICALAVATFVVLPRRGITTLAVATGGQTADRDFIMTGLSDNITLGSLGKILQDDTEALRISVSPPMLESHNLYLRGGVLDWFDGLHWQKSAYLTRTLNAATARQMRGPSAPSDSPPLPGQRIEQKITYTGISSSTLYSLPNVERLRLDHPGQFTVNPAGVITLRASEANFDVVSHPWNPHRPMEMPILAPLFPAAVIESDDAQANPNYLKIPEMLQTTAIQHLVNRIVNPALSQTEKVMFIERYLEKNYSYTLDMRAYRSNNPVEEFLFEQREGHCELFSTAMVVMLRTAGVPARLVSGFRGGVPEPEAGPGHFLMRNRDVHTWVEAWTPEVGWRQFDPTPPAPLEVFGGSLAFLTMRQWTDTLQRKANHFVFSFNREQQSTLLSSLRRFTSPWLVMLWTLESRGVLAWVMIVMAGATATLIVWVGRRMIRRRRAPKPQRSEVPITGLSATDAAFLAWVRRRLLAILGGSIRALDHDRTLREAALELAARHHEVPMGEVRDLTDLYYALRFGAQPITPDLRQDIRQRLEKLKSKAK